MPDKVQFAPRRLGHLNMFVSDINRSAAFYRDVCGFREVFREPGISMVFMTNGNTHHDLGLMEVTNEERIGRDGHVQVRPGAGKTPGLNHLGFEMSSEVDLVAAYRRARANGVPISRTTDHQISHSVYMSECNGHTFEFYADVIENWREFYDKSTGELISGHWDPEAEVPRANHRYPKSPELYKADGTPLAARNVAYAGLPVRNLDESLTYYREVLGLTLVQVDAQQRFAVLEGSAASGCDVCLVEMKEFPATRLVFGGVNLHGGNSIADALEVLRAKGIACTTVGDANLGCLIALDPDNIPLVYSTSPAGELLAKHGPTVFAEIRRLRAAGE